MEKKASSKLSAEFVHFLATGRPSSLLHKYLEMHLTKRVILNNNIFLLTLLY
jgi:hypothetical protein